MKAIFIPIVLALLVAGVTAQSSSSNLYGGDSASGSYGNDYKNNYYGYSGAYGTNLFVDSENNYYDGYQQAWRYLGWYVKCGYPSDRYSDGDSGSQDSEGSGDSRWSGNNYCQRFLIWAAYIDEGYQGGGTGEYAYYDPYSQDWDYSACDAHGNGRCVPMDCHESNSTNWKLMGVFKEASYFGDNAFFEQLFKHEGTCLWDDGDLYEFMSEAREEKWPQGCVATGIQGDPYYFDNTDADYGNYIYLDLKPTWNGNMTYGLYTDSACKTEYEGLDVNVDTVSASMGLLYGNYLEAWNDALEVYKVCQPCKAYSIKNDYSTWNYNSSVGDYTYSKQGNDDDSHSAEDDDQYRSDPNKGFFQCEDEAGYTNVNQCMKFRSHADLEVATWEDLVTATNQGGILEVNVGGTVFGSARMSSQQYQYMLSQRRETLAANAKKFAAMAVEVNKMEPEATMWQHRGYLLVGGGAALLLIALFRLRTRRIRQQEETYNQPLLRIPPGHIAVHKYQV